MTAAHFAAALAIKSRVAEASTAALIVGAFIPDFVWIILATAGVEPTRREVFFDDWSHSLLSVAAAATAYAWLFRKHGLGVAGAAWLAVFSHFALDLPSIRAGLGLSAVAPMTYWYIQRRRALQHAAPAGREGIHPATDRIVGRPARDAGRAAGVGRIDARSARAFRRAVGDAGARAAGAVPWMDRRSGASRRAAVALTVKVSVARIAPHCATGAECRHASGPTHGPARAAQAQGCNRGRGRLHRRRDRERLLCGDSAARAAGNFGERDDHTGRTGVRVHRDGVLDARG